MNFKMMRSCQCGQRRKMVIHKAGWRYPITCHNMSAKKKVRLTISSKELETLAKIQGRLSSEIGREVTTYSTSKQSTNFFERLSRKYGLKPSKFGVRKSNGAIVRLAKGNG